MLHAITIGFLLGVALGFQIPEHHAHAICAATSLAGGLWVWRFPPQREWMRRCLFFGLSLLAGVGVAPDRGPPPLEATGLARATAFVIESRADPDGSIIQLSSATWIAGGRDPPPVRTRVFVRDVSLPRGATVSLLIQLEAIPNFRNQSPEAHWESGTRLGAWGVVPDRATPSIVSRDFLTDLIEGARDHVRARLNQTLPPETARFARAMTLGEAYALLAEEEEVIRRAGLAHVLAVSGLNITLAAALFTLIMRWMLVRIALLASRWDVAKLASLLGMLAAASYTVLSGASPSAVRAGLTAVLVLGLRAIGRRPCLVRVASFAILLFAAAEPSIVVRPAFLLSICATAAVISVDPSEMTVPLRAAQALIVTQMRATLATAPLVVWWFRSFPLVGIAANLLLLPIVSFGLVPLAALHALLASIAQPLATPTGALLEFGHRAFRSASLLFSTPSWGHDLAPITSIQLITMVITCILLLAARNWGARLVTLGIGLALFASAEAHVRWSERPFGVIRLSALDVGQGDALAIDLPDGRFMLVDGGGSPRAGPRALLPLLESRRRTRIDILVLTHPHPDHYQGLFALEGRIAITELWTNEQAIVETPSGPVSQFIHRLERAGTRIRYPAELCPSQHRFGAARVEVLWPCPGFEPGFEPNDNSLTLRLVLGRRAILLTGDLEESAERRLIESGIQLRADVLKVGHHGSRTSTTPAFLASVRPRVALVSCGLANRFGHPHEEVVGRLRETVRFLGRIDRMGSVTITTDGRSLEAQSFTGEEYREGS